MFDKEKLYAFLSILLIIVGVALLYLNVLGLFVSVNFIERYTKLSSDAIPGYNYHIQSITKLQNMLDRPMQNFDLEDVNKTIFESIIHSDKRKITIYENWFLWLAGHLYDPLGRTQVASRIIKGKIGLCSEVAAVMNEVAKINGYQARFIGVNGHVVSEVLTEYGWQVADPDYGVVYPVGIGVLESKEGEDIIREKLSRKGYNTNTINRYISLFQSKENNKYSEAGTSFSPLLYAIEKISEVMKWWLAIMVIFSGVLIFRYKGV